ncbi:MAG: hypothetical protein J2P17_35800, partial [Mycobacterium sp.]|nr:hypothetical protein [Mycobacterium sp.]
GDFQYGAVATGGTPIIAASGVSANEQVVLVESWLDASTMYGEGETATGPDFPVTYTLNIEPAPAVAATGTPIDNVSMSFVLPAGIVENAGSESASGGGSVSVTNQAVTGGTEQIVTIDYAHLSSTQTVTFTAYVPQNYQYSDGVHTGGNPILDPVTGAPVTIAVNPAYTLSASPWHGIDITGQQGDISGASFDAKSLAVQLVADTSSALPTQDIHYTLRFEVSDYFGISGLGLNATLSDGLTFDPTVTPVLSVAGRNGGVSGSGSFTLDNLTETTGTYNGETVQTGGNGQHVTYTFTPPGGGTGGTTALNFDVAGLLPGQYGAGTVGTVAFAATVLDAYTTGNDQVSGAHGFLREGDTVSTSSTNDTAVSLYTYDGSVYTATGHAIADSTDTPVDTLPQGSLSLQIVEVNGAAYTGQTIAPGDTVVYQLVYTLAAPGDFADLNLAAYLPEPVFSVLHPANPDATTSAEFAGSGTSTFTNVGADAALSSLASGTYTYSVSSGLAGVQV